VSSTDQGVLQTGPSVFRRIRNGEPRLVDTPAGGEQKGLSRRKACADPSGVEVFSRHGLQCPIMDLWIAVGNRYNGIFWKKRLQTGKRTQFGQDIPARAAFPLQKAVPAKGASGPRLTSVADRGLLFLNTIGHKTMPSKKPLALESAHASVDEPRKCEVELRNCGRHRCSNHICLTRLLLFFWFFKNFQDLRHRISR